MVSEIIVKSPVSLNNKLWSMKNAKEFCDAIIIINGENIPVHKVVLASASDYFKNFFQKFTQNVMTFRNVDMKVMKLLLKYCYTGIIKVTLEIASEVLALARILSLNHILEKCLESFEETHSFDKCLSTWNVDQIGTVEKLSGELNCVSKKTLNTLVVCGGNNRKQSKVIEIYDVIREYWAEIDINAERHFSAWVILDNMLFSIGGKNQNNKSVNIVDCYDLQFGNTEVYPPMKYARHSLVALKCDNHIFAIGGELNSTTVTAVEKFDPIAKKWTEIIPMRSARRDFAGAVLNGSIYIAGGSIDGRDVASTEMYNLAENQWKSCALMNVSRQLFGLAAVRGYLYAVGGMHLSLRLDSIEMYDSSIDKWTVMQVKLQPSRFLLAAANFNEKLLIAGGLGDPKPPSMEILDTENQKFQPMTPLRSDRIFFQIVEIPWKLAEYALPRKS